MNTLRPYLWLIFHLAGVMTAGAYTYQFHHYTEVDGIPASAVLGLDQDHRGRLWFATTTGLASYDGTFWDVHGRDRGLPVAPHSDVEVDAGGRVWALALRCPVRVSWFADDRWSTLPMAPGQGWGVDTIGMALGEDGMGECAIAVVAKGGFVTVWMQERWRAVTLPDPSVLTYDLTWVGDTLFLASSRGLLRATAADSSFIAEPAAGLPEGPVYAVVAEADRDALTVFGQGWLGEFGRDGFSGRIDLPGLVLVAPEGGVSAARDELGGVYVGDQFRVFYHHPLLGLESLSRENGLVANGLTEVLVDHGGQEWLASTRGVSKLPSRRFRNLARPDGLLDDEVSAVLPREDGTMVLGHARGISILGDSVTTVALARPGFPWGRVIDLEEEPGGSVLVAMDQSGLARVDRSGAVQWFGAEQGLPEPVYAVEDDHRGGVWVGTLQGLFRQTPGGFVEEPLVTEGSTPSVRRLHVGGDGSLLVATGSRGVFRLRGDQRDHWSGDAASGSNSTYAVFEPAPDQIWVGTAGGLCRVRDGKLVPTAAPDPVITRAVFAIVEDGQGRVWFGSDAGVFVWSDDHLRQFSVPDGLIGSEVSRDALVADAQGRVWIGTDRGVSIHDERLAGIRRTDLALWIDAIEVDGVAGVHEGPLRMTAGPHELVVRFRAPDFADERRLRFQTLLAGYDEDWSAPMTLPSRSMRYTNLPAGRYQFKVRAVDVEGRASGEVVSAVILVRPPMHQQSWFVALAALAALAVMWLVFSLVQGRRYARRLAADVSDRTEALARSEAAVRAESRRLATVLESISDGVLAVDADGVVTLGNPAAAVLLGCDHTTLAGTGLDTLLPGMVEVAGAALRSSESRAGLPGPHFEFRVAAADGANLGLDCAVAPFSTAESASGGLVLAFRDVTERRRAEMERIRVQKLESLGVLAGGLAHDFNNLLTVILGNVSLLEMGGQASQSEQLEQVRTATHRAQGLTTQLLTFARGGAPQKKLTDLRPLLQDVGALALSGTSVSLDLDLSDELWHADVDPGQIEQLISNLLTNAAQAMPRGGRVRVSAHNVGRPDVGAGRRLEIRVADDGPGIAPDDLERIFEPYYTTKDSGTGLGLAIVHSVVRRHDGSISVTSEPGAGAEFAIWLPASPERARSAPVPASSTMAGSGRILVLDDEPGVRDLLVRMLQRMGYEVDAVVDGDRAVAEFAAAQAADRPYAAVIMDLTIPGGMGGKDAMARLLEIDPDVRAIVSSGYSQDPIMADPFAYGFAATLSKPFDGRALDQVLQKVLGRG